MQLGQILKFGSTAVLSFCIDVGLYTLLLLLPIANENLRILTAVAIARIFSSAFNFFANKAYVFSGGENVKQYILRYYSLCIVQIFVSSAIISILNLSFPNFKVLIKILVDGLLFFVNFFVQKFWVFSAK